MNKRGGLIMIAAAGVIAVWQEDALWGAEPKSRECGRVLACRKPFLPVETAGRFAPVFLVQQSRDGRTGYLPRRAFGAC
jgi:hypothetical protein